VSTSPQREGRAKIIRAPGGCTNPLQWAATVSIRALVFPYTAGQPAISAEITLNQHRRCRWFKSPLGHTICAGQGPTPLLLVPPWLPPQTSKRTGAFPSRHINMFVPAWSPSGRCAFASALSPIARMTRSPTDPHIATLPATCRPGSSVKRPPGSRHHGNRLGLWQHKFAGLRTRSFCRIADVTDAARMRSCGYEPRPRRIGAGRVLRPDD